MEGAELTRSKRGEQSDAQPEASETRARRDLSTGKGDVGARVYARAGRTYSARVCACGRTGEHASSRAADQRCGRAVWSAAGPPGGREAGSDEQLEEAAGRTVAARDSVFASARA